MLLLLLVVLLVTILVAPYGPTTVEAKLAAAVILPHGEEAFDPDVFTAATKEHDAASAVHAGSFAVGQWLVENVRPDTLFLSVPHGIALTKDWGIYLGGSAQGSVEIGDDEPQHKAANKSGKRPYVVTLPTVQLDSQLAIELVSELPENYNVSGIVTSPTNSEPVTLHWSEVLPLLFIPNNNNNNNNSAKPFNNNNKRVGNIRTEAVTSPRRLFQQPSWMIPKTNHKYSWKSVCNSMQDSLEQEEQIPPRKHVILSHPLRRYTKAATPEMVQELLLLGQWLRQWLDRRPEVVAVVISGDLSHTHLATGPYGYAPESALYDQAIQTWAENICQPNATSTLLETARQLQPNAKSCGFTGFVLLQGLLCGVDDGRQEKNGVSWNSRVYANRNATYFGMMAATFSPSS